MLRAHLLKAIFVLVLASLAAGLSKDQVSAQSADALATAKADAKTVSALRRDLFETKGKDATVVARLQAFADAGHPTAQFLMGEVYRLGLGVAADPVRAVSHFQAAFAGSAPGSAERLGMLHKVEGSAAFDPAKSAVYYQIAAHQGSQTARLALADFYAQGFGLPVDLAKAELLYSDLMDEGEARAAVRLGTLRHDAGHHAGAAQAWAIAAAAGRTEVLMRWGAVLRDQLGDGPGARDVFLSAQKAGITGATETLMQGDLDGAFGSASNLAEAARWLETDADLRTTIRLARALRDGNAVAVSPLSIVLALARHEARGAPTATKMLVQFYTRGTVDENATALAEVHQAMDRGLSAAPAEALHSLSFAALRRKDFALAANAMQRAATAGDAMAFAQLALWHLRAQLGPLSDPAMGVAFMKQAEPLQHPSAVQLVASALGHAQVRAAADMPNLLAVLERSALQGDAVSAALYLRALRLERVKAAVSVSNAFLKALPDAARSDQTELEYLLLRAAYANSAASWRDIALRGRDLPNPEFAKLLTGIRGANLNVLTYTLQARLAKEGYDLPQNGFLTRATARAILTFCKENGISSACLDGPLRAAAISAISQVFAARTTP